MSPCCSAWPECQIGTLLAVGILVICPLMMFFMTKGMSGSSGSANNDGAGKTPKHDPNRKDQAPTRQS